MTTRHKTARCAGLRIVSDFCCSLVSICKFTTGEIYLLIPLCVALIYASTQPGQAPFFQAGFIETINPTLPSRTEVQHFFLPPYSCNAWYPFCLTAEARSSQRKARRPRLGLDFIVKRPFAAYSSPAS